MQNRSWRQSKGASETLLPLLGKGYFNWRLSKMWDSGTHALSKEQGAVDVHTGVLFLCGTRQDVLVYVLLLRNAATDKSSHQYGGALRQTCFSFFRLLRWSEINCRTTPKKRTWYERRVNFEIRKWPWLHRRSASLLPLTDKWKKLLLWTQSVPGHIMLSFMLQC